MILNVHLLVLNSIFHFSTDHFVPPIIWYRPTLPIYGGVRDLHQSEIAPVLLIEGNHIDGPSDLLLFSTPLDDENEVTVPSSSLSGSHTSDNINESLIQRLHPRSCPCDFNWQQGHFGYPESQTDGRAALMRHIFTGITTLDDDLGVTQSEQLAPASNSLPSNSYHASTEQPGNTISMVKPRTRRRLKPIPLIGLNPHGRGGKQRCEHCRDQRQGVNSNKCARNDCSATTKVSTSLASAVNGVGFRA
jgi:hypothetical protein